MLRRVADGLDCTLVNKFFSELQCYLSTTATGGTVSRPLSGGGNKSKSIDWDCNMQYMWPL